MACEVESASQTRYRSKTLQIVFDSRLFMFSPANHSGLLSNCVWVIEMVCFQPFAASLLFVQFHVCCANRHLRLGFGLDTLDLCCFFLVPAALISSVFCCWSAALSSWVVGLRLAARWVTCDTPGLLWLVCVLGFPGTGMH